MADLAYYYTFEDQPFTAPDRSVNSMDFRPGGISVIDGGQPYPTSGNVTKQIAPDGVYWSHDFVEASDHGRTVEFWLSPFDGIEQHIYTEYDVSRKVFDVYFDIDLNTQTDNATGYLTWQVDDPVDTVVASDVYESTAFTDFDMGGFAVYNAGDGVFGLDYVLAKSTNFELMRIGAGRRPTVVASTPVTAFTSSDYDSSPDETSSNAAPSGEPNCIVDDFGLSVWKTHVPDKLLLIQGTRRSVTGVSSPARGREKLYFNHVDINGNSIGTSGGWSSVHQSPTFTDTSTQTRQQRLSLRSHAFEHGGKSYVILNEYADAHDTFTSWRDLYATRGQIEQTWGPVTKIAELIDDPSGSFTLGTPQTINVTQRGGTTVGTQCGILLDAMMTDNYLFILHESYLDVSPASAYSFSRYIDIYEFSGGTWNHIDGAFVNQREVDEISYRRPFTRWGSDAVIFSAGQVSDRPILWLSEASPTTLTYTGYYLDGFFEAVTHVPQASWANNSLLHEFSTVYDGNTVLLSFSNYNAVGGPAWFFDYGVFVVEMNPDTLSSIGVGAAEILFGFKYQPYPDRNYNPTLYDFGPDGVYADISNGMWPGGESRIDYVARIEDGKKYNTLTYNLPNITVTSGEFSYFHFSLDDDRVTVMQDGVIIDEFTQPLTPTALIGINRRIGFDGCNSAIGHLAIWNRRLGLQEHKDRYNLKFKSVETEYDISDAGEALSAVSDSYTHEVES